MSCGLSRATLAARCRASTSVSLSQTGRRAFASHAPTRANVSARHWDAQWSESDLRSESQKHVMATWGPAAGIHGAPLLRQGRGVFLIDDQGKDYLDWTSQAVCSNLGHTVPEAVKEALTAQMNTLPFVYSGFGLYENRVRLSALMAELLPGDLSGLLFPTSGAEANEAAIRIARRFTGKTKIINQYRSYHGGTTSTVTATGDFRRNFAEGTGGDGAVGFVKTMNATDNHLFSFGATDEERTAKALGFLEEQIICEGPQTIAAIMFESINGSAGVYKHPAGYMEGVRALCTKYDILMICDEVMVGFGRTGKFWGFQHYDIQPDILTSAKGLTGAWMPCSMVAVNSKIKSWFEVNPLGWGSTFHAHPMNLAVAYASVKHMLDTDLVGHVKNSVEPVMLEEVNKLVEKYDCIGQGRVLGGFACVDLLDPRSGLPIQEFSGKNCSHPEAVLTFRKELLNNGLIGFVRPPKFHCAPPLIITPPELQEGFARANRALDAYAACF